MIKCNIMSLLRLNNVMSFFKNQMKNSTLQTHREIKADSVFVLYKFCLRDFNIEVVTTLIEKIGKIRKLKTAHYTNAFETNTFRSRVHQDDCR